MATDASLRENYEVASFAIIIKNINQNFEIDKEIIEKYQLKSDEYSSNKYLIITGLVKNIDIHATEMIAIIATLEILNYLIMETGQNIILYTDSLTALKVFRDKNSFVNYENYLSLKNYFYSIQENTNMNILIKKVKAHAGHVINELADCFAKKRLNEN